ncbi:MAG TPA: BadF/BadG/BcrA/BcrD ATPase family protein [Verrucomicrobiae bacterium]
MPFFLGIDGGGTRTRAFLVDESGDKGAWGEAGATNPIHVTPEQVRTNLDEVVRRACAGAGIPRTECVSAFLGVAGVTTAEGRHKLQTVLQGCGLAHATVGVDHDIRIALAGGLAGQAGIALIVGTGSSCYGRAADGRTWQTGGWEALISDEGSGYFLGREAIAAAARMADGRTADSPLRARVFQWLEITTIADILPRVHNRGLSRSQIAAFAPALIQLAAQGDVEALSILDQGARLLAEMVEANFRMLPTSDFPRVVITGGLGTSKTLYRDKIVAEIQKLLPSAEIQDPLLPPAIGATLLAFEQAGRRVDPSFAERLRQFST